MNAKEFEKELSKHVKRTRCTPAKSVYIVKDAAGANLEIQLPRDKFGASKGAYVAGPAAASRLYGKDMPKSEKSGSARRLIPAVDFPKILENIKSGVLNGS